MRTYRQPKVVLYKCAPSAGVLRGSMTLCRWQLNTGEIISVEHQVMAKLEYQAIRTLMDAEDPRIALAFEAKVLYGDSVKKIAADLGISDPRVYQLINRAKAIGKQYRKDNDNE